MFQFGPEAKNTRNPYSHPTPEGTDKQFREWVEQGKPEDQFDHGLMGLNMMIIPTKFFGWEGITETMKKVCYDLSVQQVLILILFFIQAL